MIYSESTKMCTNMKFHFVKEKRATSLYHRWRSVKVKGWGWVKRLSSHRAVLVERRNFIKLRWYSNCVQSNILIWYRQQHEQRNSTHTCDSILNRKIVLRIKEKFQTKMPASFVLDIFSVCIWLKIVEKAKNAPSICRSRVVLSSFLFLSFLIEYIKGMSHSFASLLIFYDCSSRAFRKREEKQRKREREASECFTWGIKDTCLAAISVACWLVVDCYICVSSSLEFSRI